ncbi:hypothetical protein GAY88_20610, partial [Phocaeicola vulgatus]
LSANSVMRGRLDARRTLKSLVADLRIINTPIKDLPPLVEVIFLESMYFHSLSFRRINKGLLSIGHGKTSLFHCLFKKVEENRKH